MPLSTFLDGSVPSQLRGIAWLALSGSGQVGTLSGTTDAGGGATSTWTYGGTIPSRIDPIGGGEGQIANRISDRSTHLITLPPETPITTDSRFSSLDEVQTYEITAVRDRTSEWMRLAEAVKLD
jgi:head-tail adaptor